jgi:hypothetical protein
MNQISTLQPTAELETKAPPGILRYSAVTFHVDMTKPEAVVIPIGVMAEISLPTVYALGLIARTELSINELELVSELAKPLVAKPFKYLALQFEEAWNKLAPGAALDYLAEKHAYSALHFSVPEDSPFYLPAEPGLKQSIRMNLGVILDDQMMKLLRPKNESTHVPQPQASPQEELLQLKAKAAAA